MADALILTVEKAEELGFSGVGPFTFAGLFPGEWTPGRALRVTELGFTDAKEAEAAVVEAFDEEISPLAWTTVSGDEGFAERTNHAVSEAQARLATGEGKAEKTPFDKIRTHAQADKAAAELGLSIDGGTVAEKVEALKAAAEGAALDTSVSPPLIQTGSEGVDESAGGGEGPASGEHPADQLGPPE